MNPCQKVHIAGLIGIENGDNVGVVELSRGLNCGESRFWS